MTVYQSPTDPGTRKRVDEGYAERCAALEKAGWRAVDADVATWDDFTAIDGIHAEINAALHAAGFATFDDLRAASSADLLAVAGIGRQRLQLIREYVEAG